MVDLVDDVSMRKASHAVYVTSDVTGLASSGRSWVSKAEVKLECYIKELNLKFDLPPQKRHPPPMYTEKCEEQDT